MVIALSKDSVSPVVSAAASRDTKSQQLNFIVALRAVAAVVIVWHHVALYPPLNDWTRPLLGDVLTWIEVHARSTQVFFVLAGFVPVPLKVFTWASGIVGMPLLPFFFGMLIGRGKRVYLLAGVIRLGGKRAEEALHRWVEWIGWSLLALIALAIIYFKFLR